MSKKEFKQLSIVERSQIEILLRTEKSLDDIAEKLLFSRQTIYREILRNSYTKSYDKLGLKSSCIHYIKCHKEKKSYRLECPKDCVKYEAGRQKCLKKYPFVCNNCCKKAHCNFLHYYYDAEIASINYHQRINEANAKPKTNQETINEVNNIVSKLVDNGQSIEAILMSYPEIKQSNLTIRNWIKKGYLNCKLSSLRMFGRRITSSILNNDKTRDYKALSERKLGHRYIDYCTYIKSHPNALIIQLDTVIGNINSKYSILTIHIVNYKFQFGILLKEHTKKEVYNSLKNILIDMYKYEEETSIGMFTAFTELFLTDNGSEFDSLLDLCDEYQNIHIFYCHPLSSFEKGSCERNHVLVRYIQDKGASFDNFSQEDINILFSNINSYPRKSLNKKTPYQCVLEDTRLGKEFLNLINISKVERDDVILNPSLLRKIKK